MTLVKDKSEIGRILFAIVKGEALLDTLGEIGIEIDRKDDGFYSLKSGLDVEVRPSVADLATGLLRYSSGNKNDLRKWSFFLLAETAIDFCNIESHPQGEQLISALWDASFDGSIKGETLKLARRLTQKS
jgi:hypothetical protein